MPENNLPLLIFPFHLDVDPTGGGGGGSDGMKKPSREEQLRRLRPQIEDVRQQLNQVKMSIQDSIIGIEPEVVLVFELADRIEGLQSAVEKAGLEFLVEWDWEFEGDDEFPGKKTSNIRDARLFVSVINERTVTSFLNLWGKWERGGELPARGEELPAKWRDIFGCLKKIRRWGIKETFYDTKMDEYFSDFEDEQDVNFQIECFYSLNEDKRRKNESEIKKLIEGVGGRIIADFIEIEEIGFHAVRVCAKAGKINEMREASAANGATLLTLPSIMYFQQAGQDIILNDESEGEEWNREITPTDNPPVAAVLDGVPKLNHDALSGLINFDDPFDLATKYQDGERIHGSAMASLIIHGDGSLEEAQISSRLHHVGVLQPNRKSSKKSEHFPENCFIEDRIERAVRRTLEGERDVSATSPQIKIINLSLGDPMRIFNYVPSPWARLLDWLSWKYRVLFCVSAGNYGDNIKFDRSFGQYQKLNTGWKIALLARSIKENQLSRRLIAPAESINSLTVGALHQDGVDNFPLGNRIDLLPDKRFPSPISRIGHGFRQSVKPELYMPGGRQLYHHKRITVPPMSAENDPAEFYLIGGVQKPGLRAAHDSAIEGNKHMSSYTAGTSNAAALATRSAIQIHEMLDNLSGMGGRVIPDNLQAVMIKALLVHSSRQVAEVAGFFNRLSGNTRAMKKDRARYLGYGSAEVLRVLACTEQRCTVIGCEEIEAGRMHEYRFPFPEELRGKALLRTMIVTLAWLSPVNARRRNYREARLEIKPSKKWAKTAIKVEYPESDHHQVKRGTVQHEVFTGESKISAYTTDTEVVLHVACKEDAADELTDKIPYGLAVTLEVAEGAGINIYESIREGLQIPQPIDLVGDENV